MTTPPRRPTSASRATRRSRRPATASTPFLERNRRRLIWSAGILGFLVLATTFFLNASRPTYACTDTFNPTPAPSFVPPTEAPSTATPRPSGSAAPTTPPVTAPPPGYVQMDGGAGHVDAGTTVRYPSCPPASGKHYNGPNVGPIRPAFYGLGDMPVPPGWVHNLEHGATVLLYSCRTPNDGGTAAACTDAGQQALGDLFARFPNSPYCDIPATSSPGIVIARFDNMAWPYAAIVWDVILPLQTLDEQAIFDFQAQRSERFNPEELCPDPTPTPGPPTPTPAATPVPSGGSPAPSGVASPGASPAASPAPSSAPASG